MDEKDRVKLEDNSPQRRLHDGEVLYDAASMRNRVLLLDMACQLLRSGNLESTAPSYHHLGLELDALVLTGRGKTDRAKELVGMLREHGGQASSLMVGRFYFHEGDVAAAKGYAQALTRGGYDNPLAYELEARCLVGNAAAEGFGVTGKITTLVQKMKEFNHPHPGVPATICALGAAADGGARTLAVTSANTALDEVLHGELSKMPYQSLMSGMLSARVLEGLSAERPTIDTEKARILQAAQERHIFTERDVMTQPITIYRPR